MKKKLIVGITVTMFLVSMLTVALPARVSAQFVGDIKIGIVGPKGWIQWDGLWEGAQIARDLINDAGGIVGPDGRYRVVLVDINEYAVPSPDPASAIAELTAKLGEHPTMLNLFGGFRTECVIPMAEKFLDHCAAQAAAGKMPPIWTIAGAATGTIIDPVKTNYARYKYMFRGTPMNSTFLFRTFLRFVGQVVAPKLAQLYYGNPATKVPTFIIYENLVWCDLVPTLVGMEAGFLDVKGTSRPSAVATDFSADIAAATAKGAKLVIHVFSAVAGANFIKQYGALKPNFACIGINVESQMQEFYVNVGGACEYETFLSTVGTQEGVPPLNPDAKPLTSTAFWSMYKARFGHCPVYTAWGSYDGIIGLNETSYDSVTGKGWMVYRKIPPGSVTPANITAAIKHTETLGVSDGFAGKRVLGYDGTYYRSGANGLFKYTGPDGQYHDVFSGADAQKPTWDTKTTRAQICQWQAGRLEVIFPQDQESSRKWMIPPWMYSLETDFAGGPLVYSKVPNPATPGYNFTYTTPDKVVDSDDLGAITSLWFKKPPFFILEADMKPQDHFIDIYDAAKVGKDWLKPGTPA